MDTWTLDSGVSADEFRRGGRRGAVVSVMPSRAAGLIVIFVSVICVVSDSFVLKIC